MIEYSLSDAVESLKGLPSESVDLHLTDPAYESLEKHRAVGTTTRLVKSWFPIFLNSRYPELFAELWRTLKRNRHFYIFCDEETRDIIKPIGEEAGFHFWKSIIWDKVKIGMGYHYRARYEFVLFFEKGKRKLNDLSTPDVLSFSRVHGGYPTEKPFDLITTLILNSTNPDELVVDCFAGSGVVARACGTTGRNFLGCDISPEALSYFESKEPLFSVQVQGRGNKQ